jgi:hypothetical protein
MLLTFRDVSKKFTTFQRPSCLNDDMETSAILFLPSALRKGTSKVLVVNGSVHSTLSLSKAPSTFLLKLEGKFCMHWFKKWCINIFFGATENFQSRLINITQLPKIVGYHNCFTAVFKNCAKLSSFSRSDSSTCP